MSGGEAEVDDALARLDEMFRVALTAASMGTEVVLRARMDGERQLLAKARAETSRAQAQFLADRAAARVVYLAPRSESWWENATIEDVARAWETARTWAPHDAEALRAQEAIAQSVRRKWGVDIEAVSAGGSTAAGEGATEEIAEVGDDVTAAADDAAAAAARAAEKTRDEHDGPATEPQEAYLRGVGLHPGRDLTFEEATTILSAYERSDLRRNAPVEEVETLLRAAEVGEATPAGVEQQAVPGDVSAVGKRLDELEPQDQAAALELMRSYGITPSLLAQTTGQDDEHQDVETAAGEAREALRRVEEDLISTAGAEVDEAKYAELVARGSTPGMWSPQEIREAVHRHLSQGARLTRDPITGTAHITPASHAPGASETGHDQADTAATAAQEARDARPATDRQLAYLRDKGLDPGSPLTVGEARQILSNFEEGQRATVEARGRALDAEAQRLFEGKDSETVTARVEGAGGTEPGTVEVHERAAEVMHRDAHGVAGQADQERAAAAPRPPIPAQAAQAKQAADPAFPMSAAAAVQMGPGKTKPTISRGPGTAPGKDQGRAR